MCCSVNHKCARWSNVPHSARQIVHMDLKSPNVLLQDKNCAVAKIADLGLSRQIADGSLLTNTFLGPHLAIYELSLFASPSVQGFACCSQHRHRRCAWVLPL